jgi:hypothetical protein
MDWSMLWPWRGAAAAFLLALGVALLARRRVRLAALAAGVGILAGWWTTFGLLTASPRQLPERLPLLALFLVLVAGLGGAVSARWRWAGPLVAALGAFGAGWWMAGAPLVAPDLARAAPVLAGIAALTFLPAMRIEGRGRGVAAALVLLAALIAAAAPGPGLVLGAAVLGATLGALAGRGVPQGVLAALPLAGAVAGLAAIPVIGRGAAADWVAAASPGIALWLAPVLARRLPSWLGVPGAVLLAAVPPVAVSFFLR